MAYTVFDGVAKFTADSSQLDQFIVKLEQGLTTASEKAAASTRELKSAQDEFRSAIKAVSAEGGDTADNLQRLADAEKNLALAAAAAKQEHGALKDSLRGAKDAAREVGGSMHEARGAIALLGEEIGVHVPRHVASFLAGLPGIQAAMSAAFAPVAIFALIEIGSKLIEKVQEIRRHAEEVAAAWDKVRSGAQDAFTHTGDEILRVGAQIDELNGNKLAALKKNLELIDHQSLAELSKQIQAIQKDTDDALTKMKTWWDWITTMGRGNAGLEEVKKQFDGIIASYQNLLKFGDQLPSSESTFKNLGSAIDGAKKKLTELQEQQKSAAGEQKSVVGAQVEAQNRQVIALQFLQDQYSAAQQKLKSLTDEQQHEADLAADANDMSAVYHAQRAAALDKEIEGQKHSNDTLALAVNLQLRQMELEQARITVATSKKGDNTTGLAEAEIAAEKTTGEALLELRKQQDLLTVEERERLYSLLRAADQKGFAGELDLLAKADIEKRAIASQSDAAIYQAEVKAIDDRLGVLEKEGSKTLAQQTELRAQLFALDTKHQAQLLASYTSMMERLRQILSQPVPLIEIKPPAGLDQISNEITKAFDKAHTAAQALGITLGSALATNADKAKESLAQLVQLQAQGVVSAKDIADATLKFKEAAINAALASSSEAEAFSKLNQLQKAGEITTKDLTAAKIRFIQAEIDAAKAEGLDQKAIDLLTKSLQKLEEDPKLPKFQKETHQFSQLLQEDMHKNGLSLKFFTDLAQQSYLSIAQGIGQAFAAAIQGQESLGQALRKATGQVLDQIGTQAMAWGAYFLAKAIADIFNNPPAAGPEATSGAELLALGAALSAGGAAISGAGGGGGSGSGAGKSPGMGPQPVQTTGGASQTPQPSGPTTVVVGRAAEGGLATAPTLLFVGDSKSGGNQKEAILPLEDDRAMGTIADALIPSLLASMMQAQDDADRTKSRIPRFFDGALISAPMLAMLGDSASGAPAAEGVLPLENDSAMSRIASSIASRLVLPNFEAGTRYDPGAISDLLSRSTLAAAGGAIQHSISLQAAESSSSSPAYRERDAQRLATAFAKALDGKTPLSGTVATEFESTVPRGDTHNHLNVKGMISSDNLKQLIKQINRGVVRNTHHLKSSNTLRINRRSQ